jgi:NAD(P)-dependent dehydrogenase (short-subunit alcohol dehydrogenase family)
VDPALTRLFDLSSRVAIVTGATKGLGRSIAEGLAWAGASVVVSSRDQEGCDRAAADIARRTGRPTLGVACHMGDWAAVPRLVERVRDQWGRIDVVVNNAGIHPSPMSVIAMTSEYLDKLFAVNLKGPVRLAGLVAPVMADQGGGSIINVATIGAYAGGANVGAYTSVKAALINFTKVMAKEWAPLRVRVNALCPGPFDSEMMRGTIKRDPEFPVRAGAATLQQRVAECDEIIGAAVYLASDASSFVTGEDHVVAGGMLRC